MTTSIEQDRRLITAVERPEILYSEKSAKVALPPLRQFDALGGVTVYLFLLFFVPSRWVLPGLGGAGQPANIFAIGLLALWCIVKIMPDFEQRRSFIRWPLLIYAMSIVTSYALAFDRGLPEIESLAADRSLMKLAGLCGMILVASEGFPSFQRLELLTRRLTVMAAAVAFLGVLQFYFRFDPYDHFRFPGLVVNHELTGFGSRGTGGLVRVRGSMGHPIEFGVVMAMALPLAIHHRLHARERRQKWISSVVVGLVGVGATLTVSRSAVVAVTAGMIVLVWAWSYRYRFKSLGVAVLSMVAIRAVIPGLLGTLRSLFSNWGRDPSIQNRLSDYDVARGYIADRPWFGRGAGTFIPTEYVLLDNAYLGLLIATGVIGLGTLVFLFLSGIAANRYAIAIYPNNRARHLAAVFTATIVVALVSAGTFDFFGFHIAPGVLVVIGGLSAAMARPDADQEALDTLESPEGLLRPAYRYNYTYVPWWRRLPEFARFAAGVYGISWPGDGDDGPATPPPPGNNTTNGTGPPITNATTNGSSNPKNNTTNGTIGTELDPADATAGGTDILGAREPGNQE